MVITYNTDEINALILKDLRNRGLDTDFITFEVVFPGKKARGLEQYLETSKAGKATHVDLAFYATVKDEPYR